MHGGVSAGGARQSDDDVEDYLPVSARNASPPPAAGRDTTPETTSPHPDVALPSSVSPGLVPLALLGFRVRVPARNGAGACGGCACGPGQGRMLALNLLVRSLILMRGPQRRGRAG